jgi:hypothetical protein
LPGKSFITTFPGQASSLLPPKDGKKVKAGEQELSWHALERINFNGKLLAKFDMKLLIRINNLFL